MSDHAAGDPFSQAYRRNGGAAPPRSMGRVPMEYAGYGLTLPNGPGGCPPGPQQALEDCVRAAQQLLEQTIQIADPVPWQAPPFRSMYRNEHKQAVLSTTAAFNAATNAAGIALRAANSVGGALAYTPDLLEMGSATDFKTIFELHPPQAKVARVVSWGISPGSIGAMNLAVKVFGATLSGPPSPPNPFLSGHEVSDHQPTFFLVQPDQVFTVQVALRDVTAPTLVDFGVCYYLFDVTKRVDSKEGMLLKSGYGMDCK